MKRLFLARACVTLACFASFCGHAFAQSQSDGTKEAARAIYPEIAGLPLHAVCVRDFFDEHGKPFVLGKSIAARFSSALSEQRGPLTIASRARLRIIEERYKWTGVDLTDSTYAERFSEEMGVEGFLQGQISEAPGEYRVSLTLLDRQGHELLRRTFVRKND